MPEQFETVVIGAGQAGLSVSHLLRRHDRDHVVLERGRVAETWRTQRWDSFHLNTPNWGQRLPGHHYAGDEPDAFAPLAEVVAYLEEYANGAPVRTGVNVTRLRRDGEGWAVEANGDRLHARNVVVATGAFQQPAPRASAELEAVFQLHTSEYKSAEQLPPGAVLIVGGGQSGCQIADELLQAGRKVFLSVGRCGWLPRRYRGREIIHWMIEIGLMDQSVDSLPDPAARLACNPPVSGDDGGHDCNPRWLAQRGAILLGRLTALRQGAAQFGDDLVGNLAKGDELPLAIARAADEHIATHGLDAPPERLEPEPVADPGIRTLDLAGEEVGTILWAAGFRPDLGWIDLPLCDDLGWPRQTRGVTDFPGLYFVGLQWLHKRKSALFLGVGEDAEHVVSQIAGAA